MRGVQQLSVSVTPRGNLSPTRLQSSRGRRNARPTALMIRANSIKHNSSSQKIQKLIPKFLRRRISVRGFSGRPGAIQFSFSFFYFFLT